MTNIKTLLSVSLIMIVASIAILPLTLTQTQAKDQSCEDLKKLTIVFNRPIKGLSIDICGGGPSVDQGARDMINGVKDNLTLASNNIGDLQAKFGELDTKVSNIHNGTNGTTLPSDVISAVMDLSAKSPTLEQIIAAFNNGTLGNGGDLGLGCAEFNNGTTIGECPPTTPIPPVNETQPPIVNETQPPTPVINETEGGGNESESGNFTG